MQLSKKLNVFSEIFTAFLKSIFNFEHLEKAVEPHSLRISENIASKSRDY